jgi:hypothetical protein
MQVMEGFMRRIGFLVGNGLSISATQYLKDEFQYNTSQFFSWDVKTPGQEQSDFLYNLPRLNSALEKIDNKYAICKDFDKVNKILEYIKQSENSATFKRSFDSAITLCEMQHYLAIAFSKFQIEFDKKDISNWEWVSWFKMYGQEVLFCLSLNYDLVFERILERCNIKYRRIGVEKDKEGLLILKPHGSIDFEIADNAIDMGPSIYPLLNAVCRNNCPIKALSSSELLKPRKEVDIILPNEYSYQSNYQWIRPGYECIQREGNIFSHFVIVGVSYWDCDRPEIDLVLNSLLPNTHIIIADPYPNDTLIKILKNRFSKVTRWISNPSEL